MTITPSIIVWGLVLALLSLRLIVLCLRDEEPPPMGWILTIGLVWSLIMLVRAICLSPYPPV